MFKGIRLFDLLTTVHGISYYNHKDYVQAQNTLSKIIEHNPNSAYLNFKYGMCFYKQGKWQEALVWFNKAIKLSHFKSSWHQQIETCKKNIKLADMVDKKGKKQAEIQRIYHEVSDQNQKTLIDNIKTLFAKGQYWLVISELKNKKISKYNALDEYQTHYLLGLAYDKLEDYENAFIFFEKAYNLSAKKESDLLHRIAISAKRIGNDRVYNEVYELLISDNIKIRNYGLGLYFEKSAEWEIASHEYITHLSLFPDESNIPILNYKIAYCNDRLYRWDTAIRYYEQAIKTSTALVPEFWFFRLAQSYEKQKDYLHAIINYEKAVERSNKHQAYWLLRLAYCYQEVGLFKKASETYKKKDIFSEAYTVPSTFKLNETQLFLATYQNFMCNFPIKDNFILFESFLGANISCSPYAILLNLIKNSRYHSYTFIIAILKDTVIPDEIINKDNIIFVERESNLYLEYLATAKYLINNSTFPYYFIRRKEQKYLNTYHGIPMKSMGTDIQEPFLAFANTTRNFLQATHIIMPNDYTADIFLDKYNIRHLYQGALAKIGYPRIDITKNMDEERKRAIKQKIGIDLTKKIILYAPTWRGTNGKHDLDIKKLKSDIANLSSTKYQLIFRGHSLSEDLIRTSNLNAKIPSSEFSTNELLAITDILISDYSSVVFDFIHTNKPIISYAYDYDAYKSTRGIYFEKNKLVGYICDNIIELRKLINDLIDNKKINHTYNAYLNLADGDKGSSTSETIDFFFDDSNVNQIILKQKKPILLYAGTFDRNGITKSFINNFNLLSFDEYQLFLVVDLSIFKGNPARKKEIMELDPQKISIIPRWGYSVLSKEELWIREQYQSSNCIKNTSYLNILDNYYARESIRIFGYTKFNLTINFEGYVVFWNEILLKTHSNNKIIFQHNNMLLENKTKYPYLKTIFNSYDNFDYIISVSRETMETNRENIANLFNINDNKFKFLRNLINYKTILEKSEEIDTTDPDFSFYMQDNHFKILNIARFSHEKDHEKLIYAIDKLRNYNFTLYLLGEGLLKKAMEELIFTLQLTDKIKLLGYKENPYPYLNNCDLFVLPSNHEGQPVVLLEALVLNKKILATDIPGNRSVLHNEYGMLVDNSIDGVASGIRYIIEDKHVTADFNYEKYNQQCIDDYHYLLSSLNNLK